MKIGLVLNDDFSMWHFRKGLIRALTARGIEVLVVTPQGPYVPKLISLGVKHVAVPIYRFISPLRDLRLCFDLYRVFRWERPDLVHNMSIKPNIYGAIAARLAGIREVVALIEGLGYAFADDTRWRQRLLRFMASRMYWLAGKLTTRVWFQNADDLSFFVSSGLVSREKVVLIRSGGINLNEFSEAAVNHNAIGQIRKELGLDPSDRVVMMVTARMVWSKGVKEFVEASQMVSRRHPAVRFLLVGPLDPGSPDAVPAHYLQERRSRHFMWLDFQQNVREILAIADVVALPSYYREGIPRTLLEAMALSKPIVTTENVGCREVVDEGKNGFLVPPRDPVALAQAIEVLITTEELRKQFGSHSRAKAEDEFDERLVVSKILKELYELSADRAA